MTPKIIKVSGLLFVLSVVICFLMSSCNLSDPITISSSTPSQEISFLPSLEGSVTDNPLSDTTSPIETTPDLSENEEISKYPIIGLWKGTIKIQGEGPSATYAVALFRIDTSCPSSELCLTIMNEDGTIFIDNPPLANIPYYPDKHTLGEYCFILEEPVCYDECFTLQSDGTLDYQGGGALTSFEGILSKAD